MTHNYISLYADEFVDDWDSKIFPQLRFTHQGKKGMMKIMITHAWCAVAYKEQIKGIPVDLIFCCHGETIREITGDQRIVTAFGNHQVWISHSETSKGVLVELKINKEDDGPHTREQVIAALKEEELI